MLIVYIEVVFLFLEDLYFYYLSQEFGCLLHPHARNKIIIAKRGFSCTGYFVPHFPTLCTTEDNDGGNYESSWRWIETLFFFKARRYLMRVIYSRPLRHSTWWEDGFGGICVRTKSNANFSGICQGSTFLCSLMLLVNLPQGKCFYVYYIEVTLNFHMSSLRALADSKRARSISNKQKYYYLTKVISSLMDVNL